jgi:hypothetical protein
LISHCRRRIACATISSTQPRFSEIRTFPLGFAEFLFYWRILAFVLPGWLMISFDVSWIMDGAWCCSTEFSFSYDFFLALALYPFLLEGTSLIMHREGKSNGCCCVSGAIFASLHSAL